MKVDFEFGDFLAEELRRINKSLDNAQILINRLAMSEDSALSCRRDLFLWWYRKQSLQLNVLLWCLD